MDNKTYEIFASPFSKSFNDFSKVIMINLAEQLINSDISNKILILKESIAQNPFQAKDNPFYYPAEHKFIIDLLEEKRPKAIIAINEKHPMSGLSPFPLFEDGNFSIPSAYTDKLTGDDIIKNDIIHLCINSKTTIEKSCQIIASKRVRTKSKGKIMVCAHMDTKYGTQGALDNASGVCVLFKVMQYVKDFYSDYDMDFVPFNSEEYYESNGEVIYQNYINSKQDNIKLVINIDSPCHSNRQRPVVPATFHTGGGLSSSR